MLTGILNPAAFLEPMFGQEPNKYRRYWHLDRKRMRRECKRPESCNQVDTEDIEHIVLRYLFEMFGNLYRVFNELSQTSARVFRETRVGS